MSISFNAKKLWIFFAFRKFIKKNQLKSKRLEDDGIQWNGNSIYSPFICVSFASHESIDCRIWLMKRYYFLSLFFLFESENYDFVINKLGPLYNDLSSDITHPFTLSISSNSVKHNESKKIHIILFLSSSSSLSSKVDMLN